MSANRTRDKSVTLWLTEEEREQVRVNARWFSMTTAEFLRHAALGGTTAKPALSERAHRRSAA